MRPGDAVRIGNPARGSVAGSVIELTTPAALPALPSHSFDNLKTASVRAILREWHVEEIALLAYRWNGREVAFIALRISEAWYDLKRQPLTIEVITTQGGAPL